ncbi:hypothetical protein LP422_08480 [Janibacter limosus]|uniref:Uncharacterized protein n=1 Tax=Janibacter limosus TaxID=53458 RepID=A0AC61U7M5_9MICO|nr:hypothetical protein [Janibacter limosus]UUZ45903.1 hypothetical protein LP422_08480 [Janibacter limosus]
MGLRRGARRLDRQRDQPALREALGDVLERRPVVAAQGLGVVGEQGRVLALGPGGDLAKGGGHVLAPVPRATGRVQQPGAVELQLGVPTGALRGHGHGGGGAPVGRGEPGLRADDVDGQPGDPRAPARRPGPVEPLACLVGPAAERGGLAQEHLCPGERVGRVDLAEVGDCVEQHGAGLLGSAGEDQAPPETRAGQPPVDRVGAVGRLMVDGLRAREDVGDATVEHRGEERLQVRLGGRARGPTGRSDGEPAHALPHDRGAPVQAQHREGLTSGLREQHLLRHGQVRAVEERLGDVQRLPCPPAADGEGRAVGRDPVRGAAPRPGLDTVGPGRGTVGPHPTRDPVQHSEHLVSAPERQTRHPVADVDVVVDRVPVTVGEHRGLEAGEQLVRLVDLAAADEGARAR